MKTLKELAALAGRHVSAVRTRIYDGILPQPKLLGYIYYYDDEQAEECLNLLGVNPGRGRPRTKPPKTKIEIPADFKGVKEVAEMSGRSIHSVKAWVRDGKLPRPHRVKGMGPKTFWTGEQVEEVMKRLGSNPGSGNPDWKAKKKPN